ncbi:hypothetical protein KSP39_PZI000570 [Platanthera zijinensis]|uniref:Uncharacterized protein n=1 Tax=Platanthera zijinensis TaxID=2320716 RepID=A0AAP0C4Q7_9ASPA
MRRRGVPASLPAVRHSALQPHERDYNGPQPTPAGRRLCASQSHASSREGPRPRGAIVSTRTGRRRVSRMHGRCRGRHPGRPQLLGPTVGHPGRPHLATAQLRQQGDADCLPASSPEKKHRLPSAYNRFMRQAQRLGWPWLASPIETDPVSPRLLDDEYSMLLRLAYRL